MTDSDITTRLRHGAANIHSIGPVRAADLLTEAAAAVEATRTRIADDVLAWAKQREAEHGFEEGSSAGYWLAALIKSGELAAELKRRRGAEAGSGEVAPLTDDQVAAAVAGPRPGWAVCVGCGRQFTAGERRTLPADTCLTCLAQRAGVSVAEFVRLHNESTHE